MPVRGPTVNPLAVAIMQPYFLPYAGYFRLFAATDLLVIYDCVQFPRRGWVHRNRLVDASGKERWLTLPLAKSPQRTLIRDLRFPPDAADILAERLRSFSGLAQAPRAASPIMEALHDVSGTPVSYIERLLNRVVVYLDLPWNVVRSSSLGVPESFRGQDRILEVARRVGAREYVNAPGGRHLYDRNAFAQAGIELRFLSDYSGPSASILARILSEDPHDLAKDIRASAHGHAPHGPAPGLNSAV
jgi:hypothetical protein